MKSKAKWKNKSVSFLTLAFIPYELLTLDREPSWNFRTSAPHPSPSQKNKNGFDASRDGGAMKARENSVPFFIIASPTMHCVRK